MHYVSDSLRPAPWHRPALRPAGRGLRALALLSAAGLVLVVARGLLTGNWWFLVMLTWNLLLAWFPLGVVLVLRDLLTSRVIGQRAIWAGLALWLVFLPNASYIITDLFHLREVGPNLLWFDTITLFLFALAGLLAGLYSCLLAHRLLHQTLGPLRAWTLLLACQWLAGFGIYLGRYGRWNSWNVVTQPARLTQAVAQSWHDPMALHLTLTYGFVLAVLYIAFWLYVRGEKTAHRT